MPRLLVVHHTPSPAMQAVLEAVREVCDNKIAPYAAAVDEESRFPQEALDALTSTDFHAPHIAEEYDGVGADALATCIVIEEVARVCASSSLIPAVNKLGTMPLILGASEEIKAKVGWLAYVVSGMRNLMFPPVRLEISVDDGPWTRHRARTVVVGNVGMSGRKEFLLGNVPNRVSHNVRRNLLIVNTAAEPEKKRGFWR